MADGRAWGGGRARAARAWFSPKSTVASNAFRKSLSRSKISSGKATVIARSPLAWSAAIRGDLRASSSLRTHDADVPVSVKPFAAAAAAPRVVRARLAGGIVLTRDHSRAEPNPLQRVHGRR